MHFVPAREIAIDLTTQNHGYGALAPALTFCVLVITVIAGFSRTVLIVIAGVVFKTAMTNATAIVSMLVSFPATFVPARIRQPLGLLLVLTNNSL